MSVHSAHPEIRDERIRDFPLYDFKRLRSGVRAQCVVAHLPQYVAHKVGHVAIVINDHYCSLILIHPLLSVITPACECTPREVIGSEIVKRVPAGPVSRTISPSWSRTIDWLTASPIPVPFPTSLVVK